MFSKPRCRRCPASCGRTASCISRQKPPTGHVRPQPPRWPRGAGRRRLGGWRLMTKHRLQRSGDTGPTHSGSGGEGRGRSEASGRQVGGGGGAVHTCSSVRGAPIVRNAFSTLQNRRHMRLSRDSENWFPSIGCFREAAAVMAWRQAAAGWRQVRWSQVRMGRGTQSKPRFKNAAPCHVGC